MRHPLLQTGLKMLTKCVFYRRHSLIELCKEGYFEAPFGRDVIKVSLRGPLPAFLH